jgi:predicted  nucleic acid-binding Zn-ribbon protein
MARRKKPENETPEQTEERLLFEKISNFANRSEKTAWKRKLANMEKLIEELEPVQQKILDIIRSEKQPILDQIQELRQEMVNECIHPYEHLVQKDGYVECKFCNKSINVLNG